MSLLQLAVQPSGQDSLDLEETAPDVESGVVWARSHL